MATDKSKKKNTRRNGPVSKTRVADSGWQLALQLAGGDDRFLRVVSASTVVVEPTPRPWTARQRWPKQ